MRQLSLPGAEGECTCGVDQAWECGHKLSFTHFCPPHSYINDGCSMSCYVQWEVYGVRFY